MIAAQSQLQEPVFTLNLKSSKEGKLTFGSIDKKQYKGDLMKSTVNEKGYPAWVASVTMTSGDVKITQPMLFDSGAGPTTYAVRSFVDNYWKQVPGAQKVTQPSGLGQWIYPCSAKLPDVKVSIGQAKTPMTIAGSKFKGAAVGPQAKGACIGHLQGDPYTILGNMALPFFTSAFVSPFVWDKVQDELEKDDPMK
ncbi:MAG: hypothetical protein Q9216_005252 [Gyalolechia sp. 2 TL-2023]